MSNNWKYTMQKHKGKLWVSGSILATGVIGAGVWLAVSDESPFSPEEANVNYLASHVMTSNADGKVNLLSVENNEMLDSTVLPAGKSYLFSQDKNHEQFYAYDGESIWVLKEQDNKLVSERLAEGLPSVSSVTQFSFDGKTMGLYSKETKMVTVLDTEQKKVLSEQKESEMVEQVAVQKDTVYYITSSELVKVAGKKVERIELGETLLSLHLEDANIIVQSNFGNEKEENVLFSVNGDTLEIESLQKTGSANTTMLSKDDGEAYYMAGKYVEDESPYYLLDRYKVDAEGLVKDNLTVKVPTGEQNVLMDAQNSILDHDYIYVQADEKLKVFDVKSQVFSHEIPVSIDFAMPVLNEGGGENE